MQVHRVVAVPIGAVIATRGAVAAVGLNPPGAQELAQRLDLRLQAAKIWLQLDICERAANFSSCKRMQVAACSPNLP